MFFCFHISFFHIVCLYFSTTPPVLNKFLELVALESFRPFSKPFSSISLIICITCAVKFFEMFVESCRQPEVRRCQIQVVGRVWSNFKTSADKKNQLDFTFCILYFSSNSCSTCFGQPCTHHQELTTA